MRGDLTIRILLPLLAAMQLVALVAPDVRAQGGCGSICFASGTIQPELQKLIAERLEEEADDQTPLEKKQVKQGELRFYSTVELAQEKNWRIGSDDIPNPMGAKAHITLTSFFFDYGVSDRWTVTFFLPYVRKVQNTIPFGRRTAQGIGDIAALASYELIRPQRRRAPSVSVQAGLKFPTGQIDAPRGNFRLEQPFQVGSGAYDVLTSVNYYQDFGRFGLWGQAFFRIPLHENRFGYKFANEYRQHVGVRVPLPVLKKRIELLAAMDSLIAGHDRDSKGSFDPPFMNSMVLQGTKVLITGGKFIDFTPGVRVSVNKDLTFQINFQIPVLERWNGFRPLNLGQVAPDRVIQFTMIYNLSFVKLPKF